MEKKYITPEMEITKFESDDVITVSVSTPDYTDPNTPSSEGWG